jgi:hypothetical protein
MDKINNKIAKFIRETIGRFIACAKLYRNDLNDFKYSEALEEFDHFQFFMPNEKEWPLFVKLYEGNENKLNSIRSRFSTSDYICFAYKDLKTGRIAYARWLCQNGYYSESLRRKLIFNKNEALTLDSFTHPDYRFLGLHKKMNYLMLHWIKENTHIRYIYMVIGCWLPHLVKIPWELGYKPVSRNIYFKKGSLRMIMIKIVRKLR